MATVNTVNINEGFCHKFSAIKTYNKHLLSRAIGHLFDLFLNPDADGIVNRAENIVVCRFFKPKYLSHDAVATVSTVIMALKL